MRNKLITVMLASITAGSAISQGADPSASATNALQSNSVTTHVSAPAGTYTNPVLGEREINQQGSFGLGPMLGEPLGLGMKFWLSDAVAVDGGVGWSFPDPDGCQLHADVLFHKFDLWRAEARDVPVYIGVGGRGKFVDRGDNRAGLRIPVGVAYLLRPQRLEIYAEIAPVVDFAPTTTLRWNGGVGIRFYF
jgi:hypothetical protein